MAPVIAALVSVILGSCLAWFVGTRITYGWDEVKRQRESDLAALKLFYECYGKFFAAWKMWGVYLRREESDRLTAFPLSDPTAWGLLRDVEAAEGGFESILMKLASEYATSEPDRQLLACFRQGAQSLRESMRDGKPLTWKAQAQLPDRAERDDQRLLDYRRYRAFKALGEYVALKLVTGPAPRERSRMQVLLGVKHQRMVDPSVAAAALIEITQTAGMADRWYVIAEKKLCLPDVAPFLPAGR